MLDLIMVRLIMAFEQPGCALCRSIDEGEESWLWIFLWENVNDAGLRERLAASWGFCHRHAWRLVAKELAEWGSGLGTALVYRDFAGRLLRAISSRNGRPGAAGLLRGFVAARRDLLIRRLSARAPCPLCSSIEEAMETDVLWLARGLAGARFRLAYSNSDGLCLPHLRRALARVRAPADRDFLLDHQQDVLERVARADLPLAGRLKRQAALLGGERPTLTLRGRDLPRESHGCRRCRDRRARESMAVGRLVAEIDDGGPDSSVISLWGSLCADHLWAAHGCAMTAAGGERLAAWYPRLMAEILASLRAMPPPQREARWRHLFREDATRPEPPELLACPVCPDAVEATLPDLAADVALCLPHLRGALQAGELAVDEVLSAEERLLVPLLEELGEFVRKHDYRFGHEPKGEEQTSWWRAVALLAGDV